MGNFISKAIDFIGDLFRRTPYKSIEFRDGLIRVDFYFKPNSARHTYVLISTANNVFNLKLDGRLYAYGYLLAALEQGKTAQIEGYAMKEALRKTLLTFDSNKDRRALNILNIHM